MTQVNLEESLRKLGLTTTHTTLSYLERGKPVTTKGNALSFLSVNIDLLVGCSHVLQVYPEWFLTEHKNITAVLPKGSEITDIEFPKPNDVNIYFGPNLRQRRLERGWTQGQLAEGVRKRGLPMVTSRISMIESKKDISVTVDQFMALVDALDTTVNRLLCKS
jgi:transcriptional regulator with XRE-family HTH domain